MSKSVAIVGAGVSGLTCGVQLAEMGYRAVIVAHETGAQTTSGAAGAIWYPYDTGPTTAVMGWALETYQALQELCADARTGVFMIELRTFARTGPISIPAWATELGVRHLRAAELPLSLSFASGFAMDVPVTDTTIYLDYLDARFAAVGGVVRSGPLLKNLEEVGPEFDLVVHCAGLGARELADDTDLEPHRGQVALIPKIDLPYAVVCDDPPLMYVLPRTQDCLLGGTNELSESREPAPDDTAAIVRECRTALGIREPTVLREKVGLRPFRKSGVRLEAGRLRDGRAVIHNYGHGGSGFTLSWGCAREVARLVASG